MEKQRSVETNIPRINSEASQRSAGSTLGDDYDLDKQLEFNEGILYNPRLIYDNIAIKLKVLSRRDKILQIKLLL